LTLSNAVRYEDALRTVPLSEHVVNSDTPSDSPVDSESGTGAFLDTLNVSRNAKIGLVIGVAFAALIYVVRVFELLGPAQRQVGGPILYLGLAFVLAFGTFVIVTFVLTLVSAYRRTRELD
jgi:hypothetical protein